MKILILFFDSQAFLDWLYHEHPGLAAAPFDEQARVRAETLYFRADYYSRNLRRLGHEAWEIYPNNAAMQYAWARDYVGYGGPLPATPVPPRVRRQAASGRRFRGLGGDDPAPDARAWAEDPGQQSAGLKEILTAQLRHYRPDVLLNQNLTAIPPHFLARRKAHVGLLVGQHWTAALPEGPDYRCYDLVVSSSPATVEYLRGRGLAAELLRLGFEPDVLAALHEGPRDLDLTFVGNLRQQGVQSGRVEFLEQLAVRFPQLRVWAASTNNLAPESPLRSCYAGQAWGRDMFQILRRSKMALNHHGAVPLHANNMRLYEATGVGALLVTDWKPNLPEMFAVGQEVVAYHTVEDCAEAIAYYLAHDAERAAIAAAGQQRTLREHTYRQRMEQFLDIVQPYLRRTQPAPRVDT